MRSVKELRYFTIIELLVVIAIISILAAMTMPALNTARTRAQETNCRSNMRQFGLEIEMYSNRYNTMPPFLSALYPEMPGNVYLCPSDPNDGMSGSWPPWTNEVYWAYPETFELSESTEFYDYDNPEGNRAGNDSWEQRHYSRSGYEVSLNGSEPKEPWKFRNQNLHGASYMYEFSIAAVPSHGTTSPDSDYWGSFSDAIDEEVTTWHDFKQEEMKVEGTKIPVIRCYFHMSEQARPSDLVINLGYHFGVYNSGASDPHDWRD